MPNPYRQVFYKSQAAWHGHENADVVLIRHAQRVPYYRWYTSNWLPTAKDAAILDIGCGAGQFLYFLREEGYCEVVGVDVDTQQVELGRSLGLNCVASTAQDFLASSNKRFALVSIFDVLEHLTLEEVFALLNAVTAKLTGNGRLLISVPNAESPSGLYTRYSDITHECAYTPTSISALLYCHGLRQVEFLDPWPAPVTLARRAYRMMSQVFRRLESARLRLLGLSPPRYWSPVLFVSATK